jgi:hypothetical protein
MTTLPEYFNTYAAVLAGNGYAVTPTKGKKPFLKKWHNPTPTDRVWLGKMLKAKRYDGCNVGIVCGHVVALDIDAEDPAVVERLVAFAPPTPFQRIGRAPRTLLMYRPAKGEVIPSAKFGCVEILSGGRQFVAYGIHPDTGKPYEWINSRHTPATAAIGDLPIITAAEIKAFAEAVCTALGCAPKGDQASNLGTVGAAGKKRQRARQGEMLGSVYDTLIDRDADGRVIDGREAFMAKITAGEFAKGLHASPDDLGRRVWARFADEADLSRPKGSNPRRRWEQKDAVAKARAICRKKPCLKPPRRSRGGHPASYLHGWRRSGFWTVTQRDLHQAEVVCRITSPATLAVARAMIEAVDLANGFCTLPIVEIAKRACCSAKTVKTARKALNEAGLWIAAGGVFVPCPIGELNRRQRAEKTKQKWVTGTTRVPSLYRLVPSKPSLPSAFAAKSYQLDLFAAPVIDLATERSYRRGRIPADVVALVRAEIRARGVTQHELAAMLGISQPQLANALGGRFGLSPEPAARLLVWLRKAA